MRRWPPFLAGALTVSPRDPGRLCLADRSGDQDEPGGASPICSAQYQMTPKVSARRWGSAASAGSSQPSTLQSFPATPRIPLKCAVSSGAVSRGSRLIATVCATRRRLSDNPRGGSQSPVAGGLWRAATQEIATGRLAPEFAATDDNLSEGHWGRSQP